MKHIRIRGAICRRATLALAVVSAVAAPLGLPASDGAAVREAARGLYVHGMTAAIAEREVGRAGLDELHRLLRDPTFPRRDNVVAFLFFLGDETTAAELARFVEAPPADLDLTRPEDDRSLLLAPEALGQIAAAAGSARALEALLAMTAPGADGGPLAAAVAADAYADTLRDDLVRAALRGLARAGAPAAFERLRAIADGRAEPIAGRDLRGDAARALGLWTDLRAAQPAVVRENGGSAPAGPHAAAGRIVRSPGSAPAVTPSRADTSSAVHRIGIDFANHADLSSGQSMSELRLVGVLGSASLMLGRADFEDDTACCGLLESLGSDGPFGTAGDGLDVLETAAQVEAAMDNPAARFKVVRSIRYCSGPGVNIAGCAWIGGWGSAVIRLSDPEDDAVLWLHELGHNIGLGHASDDRFLMFPGNYSSHGWSQAECAAFHDPHPDALAGLVVRGECTDDDRDDVQDAVDNCPATSNYSQPDVDRDSVGDACDNCASTWNADQLDLDGDLAGDACDDDDDGDGVRDSGDNCARVPNPAQGDVDRDGAGDACDPDDDDDGLEDADDNCPGASNPGQADFDADGTGDACESGARAADADLSGSVDGFDLAGLGRRFGSVDPEPRYDRAYDLDRDGVIDGSDLAILAVTFGTQL